ncbi:hypothetical protein BLOT_012352 [Blomia tropicalis]|nr:hypothetical protein BLOT_012352 [Blomia tropicalis]
MNRKFFSVHTNQFQVFESQTFRKRRNFLEKNTSRKKFTNGSPFDIKHILFVQHDMPLNQN